MGIINQLDLHVANLIAAGEVVERPASCIKELVENALDAGANDITIEIKRGGVQFLRVTDNGCGMSADDLPISLKRHATSKIKDESDLDGIITLGFRGEALAAISSVSDIRIMSKQKIDKVGTMLSAHYGVINDICEIGCKNGTTVIVENLFSNVPARRKFLKRDASEAMAVISLAEKLALSRPDVSFRMISDNTVKFTTAGDSKLLNAVYAVMGKEFASSLYDVKSLTRGIEVNGYIGRPDTMRASRNFQIYYINGRYFKSKTITAALEQAYDSFTEAGKFPSCVLFVNIHPSLVDVNVHPTKLEVKFSSEREVFDAVYCAVKNALINSDKILEVHNMKPEERSYYNAFTPVYDRNIVEPEKGPKPVNPISETFTASFDDLNISVPKINSDEGGNKSEITEIGFTQPVQTHFAEYERNALTQEIKTDDGAKRQKEDTPKPTENVSQNVQDTGEESPYYFGKVTALTGKAKSVLPDYRIIGVAFSAFIFVEVGEKTLIIDKHAAHERIIFESMRIMSKEQNKPLQMLLIPITAKLSKEEVSASLEWKDDIFSLGFCYETDKDSDTVCITQIPSFLSRDDALSMFINVTDGLSAGTGSTEAARKTYFEKSLYQASCKSAMKAGIKDDDVHIKWLVESLLALPDIRYCPHGRPVAYEVSKEEIERNFKRT